MWDINLSSNANDTYLVSNTFHPTEQWKRTYHRQDGHQRCQSSWTPRCHPCPDHRYQRGRPGYAIKVSISSESRYQGTYAKNALGTDQLDQLVGLGANGVALGIGGEVAQVTDVTLLIGGSAVGLAEGVDWVAVSRVVTDC